MALNMQTETHRTDRQRVGRTVLCFSTSVLQ